MLNDHQFRGSPVVLIGSLFCKRFPKNSFLTFYQSLAALGLCRSPQVFSGCGAWGLLFVAVHRLPTAVDSLAGSTGSRVCRLRLTGSRAPAP